MADQTQRLEIATVRAEVGSNILYRFSNDAVAAVAIPTESGDIQNLKQVVLEIQQDAFDKISISTTIYPTVAAGLDATADQGIFLVQSNDADEIYTVWQNQGGAAVNTGKTALSATAIQTALDASTEAAQAAEEAADTATARTAGFLAPSNIDPVARDNGLPLQVGDRYFNTGQQAERIYTDAGWQANDSQQAIADLEAQISSAPAPNGIPRADSSGKLDREWLPADLASYAELRAYTGSATVIKVVDSFRTGRFRKISIIPTGYTDDRGITIISANGWVWQRINVGEVHAAWFVDAEWVEGVTDDTNAFQRACQYRRLNGGGTVRYFSRHLIDNNLYVNDYVYLRGAIESADELLDGLQQYALKASCLLLNPAKTIYLESGASHSHGLVIPKGMALPFADEAAAIAGVASFTGNAFTARGAGVYLHDTTIWGFDKAFFSQNLERARVERIKGDCNNGIEIRSCFDIADVSNCHFWPFLTGHRGFTPSVSARPGTAYKFASVGDWNRLSRNFAFGYNRGFVIDSCDNVELHNCGADHLAALENTTSIGFEITGTSKNTTMLSCQAAAQWRGAVLNTTASEGRLLQMDSCQFWGNDNCHVKVTNGYLQAVNNSFLSCPNGVDVEITAVGANLAENRFDNVTSPVTGTFTNVTASGNTYVNCVDSLLGVRSVSTGQFGNVLDTLYSPTSARVHLKRRAGGTSAAPTALGDSTSVVTYIAQAHNGTGFNTIGGLRFQTSGAQTSTSSGGALVISTCASGSATVSDRWVFSNDGALRPIGNATQDLGSASARINNSYFAVAPTIGSDERYKTEPQAIPDVVLDAWAAVEYQEYKLLNAVELKGEKNARIHIGLIAQRVVEAFAGFGLEANDYGLLCHDYWEAVPAVEEVLDEDGQVIVPACAAVEAADRYSIRYEEALALEAALMRRTMKRLEDRISKIE